MKWNQRVDVAILYLEENNGRLGIIIVSLLLVGMGMGLKRQGPRRGCSGECFSLVKKPTTKQQHLLTIITEVNNLEREIKKKKERERKREIELECGREGRSKMMVKKR